MKKASLRKDFDTITKYSYEKNNSGITSILEKNANLIAYREEECGWSILSIAVFSQNFELVKTLLNEYSFDLNEKDSNGDSLFALASATGDYNVMRVLQEQGSNINVQNKNGETPFMFFCGISTCDETEFVMNLFLDNHVDVDIKNKKGETWETFCKNDEIKSFMRRKAFQEEFKVNPEKKVVFKI